MLSERKKQRRNHISFHDPCQFQKSMLRFGASENRERAEYDYPLLNPYYETRDPSTIHRRSHHHFCMWGCFRDRFDHSDDENRNLFPVSSVLYRKKEIHRCRWARRSIQEAGRQGENRQGNAHHPENGESEKSPDQRRKRGREGEERNCRHTIADLRFLTSPALTSV